MSNDVTGFGSVVSLIASNTFPVGITITQFADDVDPFDSPSIRVGDVAMGVNGDLIGWNRAAAVPVSVSVIPGSLDDINLSILANANRASQGKSSADDTLTLTVLYPDDTVITFANGKITDASFAKSISSGGRLKTKTYSMSFESVTGVA